MRYQDERVDLTNLEETIDKLSVLIQKDRQFVAYVPRGAGKSWYLEYLRHVYGRRPLGLRCLRKTLYKKIHHYEKQTA